MSWHLKDRRRSVSIKKKPRLDSQNKSVPPQHIFAGCPNVWYSQYDVTKCAPGDLRCKKRSSGCPQLWWKFQGKSDSHTRTRVAVFWRFVPSDNSWSRLIYHADFQGRQFLSKRTPQSVNVITALWGEVLYEYANFGVKLPPSKVPRITVVDSKVAEGAKRKKIRHGPYRILPSSVSAPKGLSSRHGILTAIGEHS
jgi:hypothetical protein